jgi:hypothetical protein
MPGRHLQFAAGCYYHLYNRGANRSTIFPREEDFGIFWFGCGAMPSSMPPW